MKKSKKNPINWGVLKLKSILIILVFMLAITNAQAQHSVKGKVTDSNGESIPMVSVVIKGTTIGANAGENGDYSITIPASVQQPILVFSFIGFENKEEIVNNRTTINVSLKSVVSELDEVVVIGYGTQKKSSITGAVASIKSDAIENRPVANISSALAGQMAGVTVIQTSGAPGAQTGSITIRGKNSINAASPLVIVDGVPGDMNSIDPGDIESLSVLKDASSAAIYGVQAANGVILITTKKGKKGERARVNYSGNVAWTTPTTHLKFLDAADYAMLYREADLNEGVDPSAIKFKPEDIEKYRNGESGYYNTDWYKETFASWAREQMHHLSLNGGSETANYNASVGYVNQGSIDKVTKYERFNARLNVDSRINKWFTAGLNAAGYRGIENRGWTSADGLLQYANRLDPTRPVYTDNDPAKGFSYFGYENPVAIKGNDGFRRYTNQQINAILYGTVYFMQNLTLKGVYSIRNLQSFNEGFKRNLKYSTFDSGEREGYNDNHHYNWYTSQLLANYNESLGKHSIALLGGVEQSLYTYEWTKASRKGGGSNELQESLNTLSAANQKNEGSAREVARRSFFGRIQYDYANKYFLEANVRMDASSIFPKDNRWGTFPAFSGAWIISRESFMSDVAWISHLKLRGGWGQTGNEEIKSDNVYPSATTYNFSEKIILGDIVYNTAKEARYANKDLKWATVTNLDLGLEMNVFENRLGFDLALYKKKTNDMLLPLSVLSILGMSPPLQNAGSVENKGFDLKVFHNLNIGKDFRYYLTLNLSYNQNKITSLRGANSEDPDNNKLWRIEGEAIGSFYGYVANGFFNTEEDLKNYPKRTTKDTYGDIKYVDFEGEDNKITAADRRVIGKNFPSWNLGFEGGFSYKNFDFSFLLQGAFDVDAYYENEAAYAFFNGGKVLERHLDRWTRDNYNASYPRLTRSDQKNFVTSSFWVEDVSYIRVKNITLGYTLPTKLTDKVKIENLKIFFSGENLFTFGGVEGLDPESPSITRGNFFPNVKKLSLGVKVTF